MDKDDSNRLVIIEDKIGIKKLLDVNWTGREYHPDPTYGDLIMIGYIPIDNSMDFLEPIDIKKLTVTVNGEKYYLGNRERMSKLPEPNIQWVIYEGDEATRLGNLLKQTDKTFRFHLNWHD
ncbi:hypothetical protein [Xenorhabdus bovienii]|uniref:DUF7823 domain-containing protein n=1 Tax=Xenorhabdus bovienii TaxID=40576 RepID=UPI0012D394B5|nr:hypothetical protein [Xenorhabdus bovienii]